MSITTGHREYFMAQNSAIAKGLSFSSDELTEALETDVSAIIREDAGKDEIEELLLGVGETEFAPDAVRTVLDSDRLPEDWRVGEALAEAYLVEHCECTFPWPVSRDEKDPESSMPGTDLVGFQTIDEGENPKRFAFGEVKTSGQNEYPPSLMYGRHGMKLQLEELRDSELKRKNLVLYLAHRAVGRAWASDYRSAFYRYQNNSGDVSILGVMVRDVTPDVADLRARCNDLGNSCPGTMTATLVALYLPAGSINGIGNRINLTREGDDVRN